MDTVQIGTGSEDSGLCLMVKGLLEDALGRRGGRPFTVPSRIGLDAPDAAAQLTLVLDGERWTVEEGLNDPDLVLETPSDLLAQLGEVPLRFGVPWMISEAGRRLALRTLLGEVRLRGLLARSPLRTGRAALDLLQLFRLLAGAA